MSRKQTVCKVRNDDCSIGGRITRGWCQTHYQRYKVYGDPLKVRIPKHGYRYTPEYTSWRHMKLRCTNKNRPDYKLYGGRGITVCDEWFKSFLSFYGYIGKRPTPQHSLDRINGDGNYEPGNVRWATKTEQCRNSRVGRGTTGIKGISKTPSNKWLSQITLNYQKIYLGIFSDIEDAINIREEAERVIWD